jgi:hypothetical protein
VNEAEFKKLRSDAELDMFTPECATITTLLDSAAAFIPVFFAGIRNKKCIAVVQDPPGMTISGYVWKGWPFMKPRIDEAIELAVTLNCCTPHACFDQGKPGRFYACHAERQGFMNWLEVKEVAANKNSEVVKVFTCQTSINLCKDCVCFFQRAADYYSVRVVLNSTKYGPK